MPQTTHGHDRPRRRWSVGNLTLVMSAVVLLIGVAAAPASATHKGSSGSFTFTGEVSGTLKVPTTVSYGGLTACSISPSQGGTDVITWDEAKH